MPQQNTVHGDFKVSKDSFKSFKRYFDIQSVTKHDEDEIYEELKSLCPSSKTM